jgi:HesB-like selenoprotein
VIIIINYLKEGETMQKLIMSQEAYEEFKSFLDENNVQEKNIRIEFAGSGCGGAKFNISIGNKEEDDLVEQIGEINFLMKPDLIDEFGVFTILSSEENNGRGLTLRPLMAMDEDGCAGCSGCH